MRNFLIHDNVGGMLALERKEDLQVAIEEQQAMGLDGLAEEDKLSDGDQSRRFRNNFWGVSGLLASCCQSSA